MPKTDDVEPELPRWVVRLIENPVFRWATLITFGPLLIRAWHSRVGEVDRELALAWILGNILWCGVVYWVFFKVMA